MDRRTGPWLGIAIAAMGAFIVWLFAQMTRNPTSTRVALTIGVCAALIALAFAASRIGRRGRR